jgi:hypothetical protein
MATFTDPKQLLARQEKRLKDVQRSLQIGAAETAGKAKSLAWTLVSGGPETPSHLAKLNHPYARRHNGKPSLAHISSPRAPLPINVQTGRLRSSLRLFKRASGNEITYVLQFTAPYSKFILAPDGTRYMVPRPLWDSLNRLVVYDQRRIFLAAKRQAER